MRLFQQTVERGKIAAVIVGHGSRLGGFDAALKKVARAVRRDGRFFSVQRAYLEINAPSIPEAISRCARRGAKEIRVLPYFLLGGRHIVLHIPRLVSAARKNFPGVKIVLCPYLGYDEKLVSLVKKRLEGAINRGTGVRG
ncbi:MAG: CbiX/SirB N-terminal domain-containing protein [Candidatus Omnitrophica bacterium]|nr:CbiX/SirB N-terminal domain-containing protein [Candidatus Omnitrophota bacterium]